MLMPNVIVNNAGGPPSFGGYDSLMRNMLTICLVLASNYSIAAPPTKQPQLRRIEVQRPNVVIHGAYLDKVEVWAVPTGTGITPDEYVLIGNAKRKNAEGSNEIWLFPIPSCATDTRLTATEIFAKGFDAKGTLIGKKSLRYVGASAVHEALCGGP
jgi:hypothetical protein